MSKRKALVILSALLALLVLPGLVMAQEGAQEDGDAAAIQIASSEISAAFAMAIASSICGIAQGRAVIAACEGMARNPSAGGQIRGTLIIGLVLIESLAIYTLLISLIILVG